MKIKIIKSSQDSWYFDKIGEEYEVFEEQWGNENVFFVVGDTSKLLYYDDCKIIDWGW
jgi:hypothetical protein